MIAADDVSRFVVLAPQRAHFPFSSLKISRDRTRHEHLLGEMQRLRGRVALHENAVTASGLDASGRHRMHGDENSWHLLRLRRDGKLAGCARILVHPRNVIFPRLRIADSPVARCTVWARRMRSAVESELRHARRNDLITIEPGGWVVDEDLRGTCDAVSIAISTFAWAQILGNCVGFLTATVNHGSSAILRRLGGRTLQANGETIPRYFDPAWGCNMELLRFDTTSMNPKYHAALATARRRLLAAPVLSAEAPAYPWSTQVWFGHTWNSTGRRGRVEAAGAERTGSLAQTPLLA
jgi:hypothetical protein